MFRHSRTPSFDNLADNVWTQNWRRAKEKLPEVFDLTLSNPTAVELPTIQPSLEALQMALDQRYQPDPQGLLTTRLSIAEYYKEFLQAHLPTNYSFSTSELAKKIQLFASTSEAYTSLFKLLCAPGDEIILFSPSYPLLQCLCQLDAIEPRFVSFQDSAGEWEIDFYALEQAFSRKTRAIVLVTPNNPTGHCLSWAELNKLEDFCANNHIALIVDEVFADFILRPDSLKACQPAALFAKRGLVFSLNGLSKVCGLPQHKLSWALCGGDPSLVQEALERLSFIADAALSASTWVQHLTPYFLQQRHVFQNAMLDRIHTNIQNLMRYTQDKPISLALPEAGWCICLQFGGISQSDEIVAQNLAARGIRIFPGSFFNYPEYKSIFVLSTIIQPQLLSQFIAENGLGLLE